MFCIMYMMCQAILVAGLSGLFCSASNAADMVQWICVLLNENNQPKRPKISPKSLVPNFT